MADPSCERCGAKHAGFEIGPPARVTKIALCGACFFTGEGADIALDRLQRVNDDSDD